jgi:hypothetical protein
MLCLIKADMQRTHVAKGLRIFLPIKSGTIKETAKDHKQVLDEIFSLTLVRFTFHHHYFFVVACFLLQKLHRNR